MATKIAPNRAAAAKRGPAPAARRRVEARVDPGPHRREAEHGTVTSTRPSRRGAKSIAITWPRQPSGRTRTVSSRPLRTYIRIRSMLPTARISQREPTARQGRHQERRGEVETTEGPRHLKQHDHPEQVDEGGEDTADHVETEGRAVLRLAAGLCADQAPVHREGRQVSHPGSPSDALPVPARRDRARA